MEFHDDYIDVICLIERSAGNDSVGDMWFEGKAFPKDTPVSTLIAWAKQRRCSGKLTLVLNEPDNVTLKIET